MAAGRKERKSIHREAMRKAGFDPFAWLLSEAAKVAEPGDEEALKRKTYLALELLPYIRPKLKAVEHSAGEGVNITVSIGGSEA